MPRAGVEDNLRSLQVERMDLVNLRLMNTDASGDLLAQQLGTLEDLHGEGKLDLIGISEAGADAVGRALDLVDIAEVQNSYSVVNRSGEDVLELCMAREIAFVPYFPLGFSVQWRPLAAGAGPRHLRGRAPTRDHRHAGCTRVAARSLRPDAADPRYQLRGHLEENMAAADVELDAHDLAELEKATPLGDPLAAAHD
ncbi:MAG: aldo/keto reductase [Actinomycetota bacterium]|nr:aldo/keto reductase [Actinomycetota bacterium]